MYKVSTSYLDNLQVFRLSHQNNAKKSFPQEISIISPRNPSPSFPQEIYFYIYGFSYFFWKSHPPKVKKKRLPQRSSPDRRCRRWPTSARRARAWCPADFMQISFWFDGIWGWFTDFYGIEVVGANHQLLGFRSTRVYGINKYIYIYITRTSLWAL